MDKKNQMYVISTDQTPYVMGS